MAILNKKPKGPTYKVNGDEVTTPTPAKKIGGYYTSLSGIYNDAINSNTVKEIKYDDVLNYIIKDEGGTPEQYKEIEDSIAFHESMGTMNPKTRQLNDGPGRGMFQYEPPSARTALNRAFNYLNEKGLKPTKWMQDLNKKELIDFSELPEEHQRMLFLIDKKVGKGDLNKVVSGKQSIAEFWGESHQTQSDPLKLKRFIEDNDRRLLINKKKPLKGLIYK